tara:strand:- start:3951 stop:4199 length:249 start_codon:yes stop_codon:yes gene_type:complete
MLPATQLNKISNGALGLYAQNNFLFTTQRILLEKAADGAFEAFIDIFKDDLEEEITSTIEKLKRNEYSVERTEYTLRIWWHK